MKETKEVTALRKIVESLQSQSDTLAAEVLNTQTELAARMEKARILKVKLGSVQDTLAVVSNGISGSSSSQTIKGIVLEALANGPKTKSQLEDIAAAHGRARSSVYASLKMFEVAKTVSGEYVLRASLYKKPEPTPETLPDVPVEEV